jgi:hypothetical protein
VLEGFGVAKTVGDGVNKLELVGVDVGLMVEVAVDDEEGKAEVIGV